MKYSELSIPFRNIPKDFSLKKKNKPEVRDHLCICDEILTEFLNMPVIEQISAYEVNPSIALLVRDVCSFRRFNPNSDIYSRDPNKTQKEKKEAVSYCLSFYEEKQQEILKKLIDVNYGDDLSDTEIVFDPRERQILLYSEKDDKKEYTINFGQDSSFIVRSSKNEFYISSSGDIIIYHKEAYNLNEMIEAHDNLNTSNFVKSPDITKKALENFECLRKNISRRKD